MLGLAVSAAKGGAALLTYVKDNLKLYLDFKSNKSDTLKFPSEGSTEFDGVDDYIDCGDIDDMDGASKITIAGWAKRLESNDRITFEKSTSTTNRIGLNLDTNGVLYANVSTGSAGAYGYASLSGTDWNHIAMVYDGTEANNATRLKLYINGIKQSSSYGGHNIPATTASSAGTFKIGRAINNSNYSSTGSATNVAIWSRCLKPEEIQSIMNKSYSQLKGVEKTSLVAWWALDDVQKVTDNSVSSGLIESATGEILSNNVSSFNSITGTGNNYTNNIIEFVTSGYAFFNISGLVEGKLYRFTYTVLTQTASGMSHSGGSSTFTGGIPTTVGSHEQYLVAGSANLLVMRSQGFRGTITDIVVQEVSNTGIVTGATTTTSVYGGNAPILPRAVDVAKEGQADAIGNGSASFNGSSDFVQVEDSSVLDAPASWTLSAWIKIGSSTSGYDRIIGKQDTSDNCNYGIGLANGTDIGAFLNDGGGFNSQYYATNLDRDEWYHVAGTWDGSYLKVYLNSILVSTSSDLSSSNASVPNNGELLIGVNKTNGNENFKGNISQAGVWQGALTQAQIQSVMESTSYSKIPADVKSTLGSERVLNSDFSDGENLWTLNNANVVNEVLEIDEGTFSYYAQQNLDESGSLYRQFESGYLMKIEIVVDEYTSGGTIIYATGNNIGTFNSAGTHTIYYKPSANEYLRFRSNGSGFEGKISSVSIKRVTNDLVAYYPLDGSSSANGVTQDVTTGEVLGSEIVTSNTTDNWSPYGSGGSEANITNGVALTAGSDTRNAFYGVSGTTNGRLYKLNVDAFIDDASDSNVRIDMFDGSSSNYSEFLTTTSQNITIYFEDKGSVFVLFHGVNNGTTVSIQNMSIKEVTSKTGVLK